MNYQPYDIGMQVQPFLYPSLNPSMQQNVSPKPPDTFSLQFIDNLDELQSKAVPMNGTPCYFMLKNDPVMYQLSFCNGQKLIQAFKIVPMNSINQQNENSIENRISAIEQFVKSLTGESDESSLSTTGNSSKK